jgi:signal transduction histidine kinase
MASEQGGLMVTVVDDGVGFDPGSVVTSRHVGLVTMRERAELSGGWWKIESSPGGGTTITFWVPAEVPRS